MFHNFDDHRCAHNLVFLSVSCLCVGRVRCSVLDLNAFERQMKAEGLGTAADGNAGASETSATQ